MQLFLAEVRCLLAPQRCEDYPLNHTPGSGIGRATAIAFAQAGAAGVMIADINFKMAEDAVNAVKAAATRSNFRVEAIAVDVTLEESVGAVMKEMVDSFQRIDYCVTCAGVSIMSPY